MNTDKSPTPPGKQNPSASAQEIAESAAREILLVPEPKFVSVRTATGIILSANLLGVKCWPMQQPRFICELIQAKLAAAEQEKKQNLVEK